MHEHVDKRPVPGVFEYQFVLKIVENRLYERAFAQAKLARHKTDKVDARIVAEYGATFGGRSYSKIKENVKELRELYRASLSLKDELVATKNHLENKELLPKSVADLWKKRAEDLEKDIQLVEKKMKEIIFADPDLYLFPNENNIR